MRWNCPHCNVALAISDEKLGTGWSFSKCYKCSGYALIRRSDVNLVKVDARISEGTGAVAAGAPSFDLENALESADREAEAARPVIRPAKRKASIPERFRETFSEQLEQKMDTVPEPLTAEAPNTVSLNTDSIVEFGTPTSFALENGAELPPMARTRRLMPVLIAVAGALVIGSGVNLYIHGKNIARRAKETLGTSMIERESSGKKLGIPQKIARAEHSDAVARSAMAPVRDQVSDSPGTSDQRSPSAASTGFRVQPRIANATLRTGPSTDYTVVGIADPAHQYDVLDFSDRWFQVRVPGSSDQTAWIRNDLVTRIR